MRITMYELLGMVKDGKAPKRIKFGNKICTLSNLITDYMNEDGDYLTDKFDDFDILNDTVEILEEEKKIPEKLDIHYDKENRFQVKVDGKTTTEVICLKINSIIDYLKSKGE